MTRDGRPPSPRIVRLKISATHRGVAARRGVARFLRDGRARFRAYRALSPVVARPPAPRRDIPHPGARSSAASKREKVLKE